MPTFRWSWLAAAAVLAGAVVSGTGDPGAAGSGTAAASVPSRVPGAGATTGLRTEILVGSRPLGTVSPSLFGVNLLWPYASAGSYDAAARHWYPGFVAALRRLGVHAVRFPGGTTADSYIWQRAIGRQSKRRANEPYGAQAMTVSSVLGDGPARSIVGPDEFGRLLGEIGASGSIVVNFDTAGPASAANLVAYLTEPLSRRPSSNPSNPAYWAARRSRDGHPAPYPVRWVEVGNEQQSPAEYGWRSGAFVSLGRHPRTCPAAGVPQCLYLFGGTTRFVGQAVGTFADDRPSASYSSGRPGQTFDLYYPPVVPASLRVLVGRRRWSRVAGFARAGSRSRVYTLDPATGAIRFGNGDRGAIPPRGARITVDYESGPHAGFVEFYQAIKRVDPGARVCETDLAPRVLELLGRHYAYDCVQMHPYAMPRAVNLPLAQYEERLMGAPASEAAGLARLQAEIRRDSGREVPVVVTEYGQMVRPLPRGDPGFLLSLDEGLLGAAQLREWILHGVPLAEKYLATSAPFALGDPGKARGVRSERLGGWRPGYRIDSAMVAGPGPHFVTEASGLSLGMLSALAGRRLLASSVRFGPPLAADPHAPVLLPLAAASRSGVVIVVIDDSPVQSVTARVVLPRGLRAGHMTTSVLNGPAPTAFNSPLRPRLVTIRSGQARFRDGTITWSFPAHSITRFEIGGYGVRP